MNSTNRGGLGRILSMQAQSGRAVGVVAAFVLAAAASAQCGVTTFGAATTSPTGTGSRSIAVGDFNGDGRLDMAVAAASANHIQILSGTGAGTFTSGALIAAQSPYQIVTGDVNNDGKLDLVTASTAGNCSAYLGNGIGGFITQPSVSVGSTPRCVALGDLNGDGKLDLVTANSSSGTTSVCLGTGNGTFAAAATYAALTNPNAVVVGDVNGDGRPDVLTTSAGTNGIAVRLGVGNGTLAASTTVPGVGGAGGLLVDVNNDGTLDVLILNQMLNQVFIVRGNGNGTFQPATTLAVPNVGSGWFMAATDFNGDGKLDLAVPRDGASQLGIYLGDGTGAFSAGPTMAAATNPLGAAVGDFNGDGKPDAAVANATSASVTSYLNTGSFEPRFVVQPVGGAYPSDADVTLTTALRPGASATLTWRFNGTPISTGPRYQGVTSTSLTIRAFGRFEAGTYDCVATGCSVATTDPAVLTLQAPNTCGADFNNDGFLDFTDFDSFVIAFEAGC